MNTAKKYAGDFCHPELPLYSVFDVHWYYKIKGPKVGYQYLSETKENFPSNLPLQPINTADLPLFNDPKFVQYITYIKTIDNQNYFSTCVTLVGIPLPDIKILLNKKFLIFYGKADPAAEHDLKILLLPTEAVTAYKWQKISWFKDLSFQQMQAKIERGIIADMAGYYEFSLLV